MMRIEFDSELVRPLVQLAVAEALGRGKEERAKLSDECHRVLLTKT